MATNDDSQEAVRHAAEQRRWLIGIGISLAFGLFGVVMTLLSYNGRSKPTAPPAAATAAPVAPESPAHQAGGHGHGKGHGHDEDKGPR